MTGGLAVTVLVALVVGWTLGMMTAACLDARRAVKNQDTFGNGSYEGTK